jgi:hypothetical protein
VRLLLDHCVPKPVGRHMPDHHVRTAAQMRWVDLTNGRLLAVAKGKFDCVITVDKNIKSQQNLKRLPIAVILLNAPRNTPEELISFVPFVERALKTIQPGQMLEIDITGKITEVTASKSRGRKSR